MSATRMPLPSDTAALMTRGLRVCEMLSRWPETALARVVSGSHLSRYARGEQVLPHAPQQRDVLVVVAGSIELSGVNAAGSRFLLARFGAGDIVGLVRLLADRQFVYDHHAVEQTLLVHIPAEHLREVLDAHPLLWRDVALLALARQHDSIITLQRRGFRRLEQNLAQALLKLLETHRAATPVGSSITVRVSQADLAAMVSVSRQTINKELRRLTDRGLLRVAYGELEIHDLAALRRLSETGSLQDPDLSGA